MGDETAGADFNISVEKATGGRQELYRSVRNISQLDKKDGWSSGRTSQLWQSPRSRQRSEMKRKIKYLFVYVHAMHMLRLDVEVRQ